MARLDDSAEQGDAPAGPTPSTIKSPIVGVPPSQWADPNFKPPGGYAFGLGMSGLGYSPVTDSNGKITRWVPPIGSPLPTYVLGTESDPKIDTSGWAEQQQHYLSQWEQSQPEDRQWIFTPQGQAVVMGALTGGAAGLGGLAAASTVGAGVGAGVGVGTDQFQGGNLESSLTAGLSGAGAGYLGGTIGTALAPPPPAPTTGVPGVDGLTPATPVPGGGYADPTAPSVIPVGGVPTPTPVPTTTPVPTGDGTISPDGVLPTGGLDEWLTSPLGVLLSQGLMGYYQGEAAQRAAEIQAQSAREGIGAAATATAPWRNIGATGLYRIASMLGIDPREAFPDGVNGSGVPGSDLIPGLPEPGAPGSEFGSFNKPYTMDDLVLDPGYEFRRTEGARGIEQSGAARGMQLSGSTLKGLEKFGQEYASDEYGRAYDRARQGRMDQYNALANISGLGQISSGQLGQIANEGAVGAGNARAAGVMGQAGAYGQALGNMNQILTQQQYLDSIFG